VAGRVDPTEHGARVIPESADEERAYGIEPNGGVRGIASGVRVINLPNGAALAAEDRLPQAPSATAAVPAVPERLGGGFLFVLGNVVWRADRWLSPARPIFTSTQTITRLVIGLDRVYVRATNGAHQAISPRDGAPLDLGPWPASSYVGPYAALDGWRAVAINDLRGAVVTLDAGATWRPLDLPMDPQSVVVLDDAIAVGGVDATKQPLWFEVRAGQVSRMGAPPMTPTAERTTVSSLPPDARPFGKRPLLAAIEDGWPLADGSAVVARDGTLARIRLEDGALVDLAPDSFPMKPSRCHPVPLGPKPNFGFVCGEPHGRTVLYAYDASSGRLEEARRFASPRAVLSSGNGALAVRGGCAEDAPPRDEDRTQQSYCIFPARVSRAASPDHEADWREVRVRMGAPNPPPEAALEETLRSVGHPSAVGASMEMGDERVVVLTDGRIAIVSPPHGDLGAARLTVLDHARSTTVPIVFASVPPEVTSALRLGVWLDGMEERRPGVIGGWAEVAGTMLGFEIGLDGKATTGVFIRDAGAPMVSGRYGLGWSASRRGYETTDGGMTWTPIDVPEPIVVDQGVHVRACGPIGCTAKGWLRVGWGAPANPSLSPPPPQRSVYRPVPAVAFECEATAPVPHQDEAASTPEPHAFEFDPWGRRMTLSSGEPRPFYSMLPPPHRQDEVSISTESSDAVEHQTRMGLLSRIYAWGPKVEDWPHAGHWQARWLWPFGESQDVHSTQPSAAPFPNADAARHSLGAQGGWSFGVGDDAAHGLLVGRRGTETTVLELEADHPIVEVRRADGEPFGEVDAAVRGSGHWYLATPQGTGDLPAEVLWEVNGAVARELSRVGRYALDGRPTGTRLARRSDGRAVGLVVDGQPAAERSVALRWVLPVDLESGSHGEPELLGFVDLGDRPGLAPCAGDELGWVLDTPLGTDPRIRIDDREVLLTNAYARVRMTQTHACIERLSGAVFSGAPDWSRTRTTKRSRLRSDASLLLATSVSSRARATFRCWRPDATSH
jgi:hypothetical protein